MLDFPRLQIAVALAIVLAACLLLMNRGRWRTMLIAGLALALVAQLARIVPYTRLVAPEVMNADACDEAARIRLFVANVEYANRDSRDLLAMVAAIDPDVVLLTEPGAWWQAQLAPLARERAYTVLQPQEDTWGMLLYSGGKRCGRSDGRRPWPAEPKRYARKPGRPADETTTTWKWRSALG